MVNILDCPSRARGSIPLLTVTFFLNYFFYQQLQKLNYQPLILLFLMLVIVVIVVMEAFIVIKSITNSNPDLAESQSEKL